MHPRWSLPLVLAAATLAACSDETPLEPTVTPPGASLDAGVAGDLDTRLADALNRAGFTGGIAATLETQLGQAIRDP